jgi:2-haloacid dehalogenase
MTGRRPTAVVFDVVETLFSLSPVNGALEEAGAGPRGGDLFFARLLRDGFALAAAGGQRSFRDLAAGAVAFVLPDASSYQRDRVLDEFARLPAQPDAEPALERLIGAGLQVVTLTNGGVEQTSSLLEQAGLDRYIEQVLSVEGAGRWKPAPEPYRYAANSLGLAPNALALVAVHGWDVHGAHQAGLVTGWASRLEGHFPETFDPPDVSGPDLVAVVDGLLALPRPPTNPTGSIPPG